MRLNIRQKILIGCTLLGALFLIAATTSYISLKKTQAGVSHIFEKIQPQSHQALTLTSKLEQSFGGLAFYLLSGDISDKQRYYETVQQTNQLMEALDVALQAAHSSNEVLTTLQNLRARTDQLSQMGDELIQLSETPKSNVPAYQITLDQLSPISQQLQQQVADLREQTQEMIAPMVLEALENSYSQWNQLNSHFYLYLAFRDSETKNNLQVFHAGSRQSMEELQNLAERADDDLYDLAEEISDTYQVYWTQLEQAIKIHSSQEWRKDAAMIRQQVSPSMELLQADLKQLNQLLLRQVEQNTDQIESRISSSIWILIGLLCLGSLLVATIIWLANRYVIHPLLQLAELLGQIADGNADFSRRVKINSQDEIGATANYFNQLMEKMQSTIDQVIGMSIYVNHLSAETKKALQQVANNSQQQVQQADLANQAGIDMLNAINHISDSCDQSGNQINTVVSGSEQGLATVHQLSTSAQRLGQEVMELEQCVNKIAEQDEGLSNMVNLIKGIADQTNLLALNAAIEAARAGDQGRGFAVVADEVRSLAAKTQSITDNIAQELEANRSFNQNFSLTIEAACKNCHGMLESLDITKEAIQAINLQIRSVLGASHKIIEDTKIQRECASNMQNTGVEVTSLSKDTAAKVVDVEDKIKLLQKSASELTELVGRFVVH